MSNILNKLLGRRGYREADMEWLSEMRPKKCPQCGQKRDVAGVSFFVGTDGITCMICEWNYKPDKSAKGVSDD